MIVAVALVEVVWWPCYLLTRSGARARAVLVVKYGCLRRGEGGRVAKEGQRILLTPRNPHCGQRNGCDGNRMLSSQYQLRYPPILAEASSISEQYPTIPTRYSTYSFGYCLGRAVDC